MDRHVGPTGNGLVNRNEEMEADIWELESARPEGNKPVFL